MKAVELAVSQKDCWRKIAITLIDPGFDCQRLVTTVMGGRRSEQRSYVRMDYFGVARHPLTISAA